MKAIKTKVEAVMQSEESEEAPFLAGLLENLAGLYSGILQKRARAYGKGTLSSFGLPCTVISVGNITLGGTGKTPMTMKLAQLLQAGGYRVAILSRGYKGGAEGPGGIVHDGRVMRLGPEMAGDEPYMMASVLKTVPVVVGHDRVKGGMLTVQCFRPDIILLDDGFQHLRLKRDINLVLLDANKPFGNHYVVPRGTLREPVSGLQRADAIILTRAGKDSRRKGEAGQSSKRFYLKNLGIPVFTTFFNAYAKRVVKGGALAACPHWNAVNRKRVFVFSGIAKNTAFHKTVADSDAVIVGTQSFADHHAYSDKDIRMIIGEARRLKAEALLTTEKDYPKIKSRMGGRAELFVMGIEVSFGKQEKDFYEFLTSKIVHHS